MCLGLGQTTSHGQFNIALKAELHSAAALEAGATGTTSQWDAAAARVYM